MTINFRGRISNMPLPKKKPLMPLFEAVVNAIQAAAPDEVRSTICVQIVRERIQQSVPGSTVDAPISGFRVIDNGVGFTDDNFRSFLQSDSRHKSQIGGKGVGRLMWLKCFSDVVVESVYRLDDGCFRRREFRFMLDDAPIAGHKNEPSSETSRRTVVYLRSLSPSLAGARGYPKGAKTIAQHLLDHCMLYLMSPKAPRIYVEDDDHSVLVLNEMLDGDGASPVDAEEIVVGSQTFHLKHLKLPSTIEPRRHRIVFFGDDRAVVDEPLQKLIPDLRSPVSVDGRDVWWTTIVTSKYLDDRVDADRDRFSIHETKEEGLLDEPSMAEICEAVVKAVRPRVDPLLEEVREARNQAIRHFIEHEAPHYRILFKYAPDDLAAIEPTFSKELMDEVLYRIYSRVERQARAEVRAIINDDGTADELEKRRAAVFEKVSDVGKSDLARYVTHRRVVIDLLKFRLRLNGATRAFESEIHSLIFPQHYTSDEIHEDGHNLWLVDERLSFHSLLISDQPVSGKSADEPDLAIGFTPYVYGEGPLGCLSTVVVIELKRPGLKFDVTKDPVRQVLRYAGAIREGNRTVQTGSRPLRVDLSTRFELFIICDITADLKPILYDNDLHEAPDRRSWRGVNKNRNATIEVLDYATLVERAEQRNLVLFRKLGLV